LTQHHEFTSKKLIFPGVVFEDFGGGNYRAVFRGKRVKNYP
jgi:hypothetical protein